MWLTIYNLTSGCLLQEGDFGFYQSLVQILIPEVLRPIPPSLTQVHSSYLHIYISTHYSPILHQAIRNFAKSLESWLTAAMVDCPPEMTAIKLSTVRRYKYI